MKQLKDERGSVQSMSLEWQLGPVGKGEEGTKWASPTRRWQAPGGQTALDSKGEPGKCDGQACAPPA